MTNPNGTSQRTRLLSIVLAIVMTIAGPAIAYAQQSVEDFYRGRTITLVVGAAAAGAADIYARTFAPYFGRYIPGNPSIVVVNRPGAGGLIVANELQHTAERDGTVIGTLQRNNFLAPLLSDDAANFDPREVSHLGSLTRETYVVFSYGDRITTLQEAFDEEMILAGTGATAENVTYPLLVNNLLGGRFNIIRGYTGNEDQELAIERGEADGRAITFDTTNRGNLARWKREGLLHLILQFGLERHPDMPDVPNVVELTDDPEILAVLRLLLLPQEFGRPFAAPPGIPEDRLAALRTAFIEAAGDPDFIADIERQQSTVELLTGEELQAMAEEIMNTEDALVQRARDALGIN